MVEVIFLPPFLANMTLQHSSKQDRKPSGVCPREKVIPTHVKSVPKKDGGGKFNWGKNEGDDGTEAQWDTRDPGMGEDRFEEKVGTKLSGSEDELQY